MKKIGIIVFASLLTTACSQFSTTGERLYLRSQNGVGLVVPPPLVAANMSHFYDLPQQNQPATVSIVPPAVAGLEQNAT